MATQELASFVADLQYEMLPSATRQKAKQCILDWLSCCIRGSIEAPGQIMQRLVARQEGKPEATVFTGQPFRTTVLNAALLNGVFSHALDMDDLHNASIIHLGTVVVPAALAVAEAIGACGQDLITAVVAGYEVGARVGEAVNPESYFFWHTTGTAGAFGAAAAAGKLLGLDAQQMVHCLGSAGTQASGLWEFLQEGAMSKTLHAGKAAMNGVLAALLAQDGFTAATRILEGEKGFCLAMTPAAKLNKLTDHLGNGSFKIDENAFKPYAACKHCHPSINAAQLLIRDLSLEPQKIQSIIIKTNSVAENLVNNPAPQTVYGCKFSLQYCVAAAFCYGQVGIEEFTPEKMYNGEVRRLMQCTTIQVDPGLDEEYRRNPEKWSVNVVVKTNEGKEYQQFIEYPKGDPQNPVSYSETEMKLRSLAKSVYTPETMNHLLQVVGSMESIANLGNAFALCSFK